MEILVLILGIVWSIMLGMAWRFLRDIRNDIRYLRNIRERDDERNVARSEDPALNLLLKKLGQ